MLKTFDLKTDYMLKYSLTPKAYFVLLFYVNVLVMIYLFFKAILQIAIFKTAYTYLLFLITLDNPKRI